MAYKHHAYQNSWGQWEKGRGRISNQGKVTMWKYIWYLLAQSWSEFHVSAQTGNNILVLLQTNLYLKSFD
jgi:hypothetical protein